LYGLFRSYFIDALLDGIKLSLQPASLRMKISGFLLWSNCCPARDPGGEKAMPPTAPSTSAPKSEPSTKTWGQIYKTGPVVATAKAHAAPSSRTSA
jgi:hypothetical protein